MNVSPDTWNVLSRLFDEALDLDPEQRRSWLERLAGTNPEVVTQLRRLLEAHGASRTQDALDTLPALHAPPQQDAGPELAAGQRVGPYVLQRLLGGGGMADVWLARRDDGALAREVALKLPLMNPLRRDLAARFARERDILARLEHPHIARLYDAGVSATGLPYLAMEYVDGRPLNAWCDERRLTVPERIRLFAQVLAAVQFAHANLVIHRDLKPSNILVTTEGQVRLLDFGIAKLLEGDRQAPETEITRLSGRALTLLYASPEQIQGEPLTIASDVYSLGVVLHELLAGSTPYRLRRESAAELEEAIVSGEPQHPSAAVSPESAAFRGVSGPRLVRLLRGDLDAIVLKALSRAPGQRYSTVAAFAEDLQRQLDGQPVRAQPPSAWYRVRKFVARHRWPVVGTAAGLLAVLAVAAVAVVQARKARAQEQLAHTQAVRASREAATVRRVSEFLTSMFKASDPSEARGNSMTVREVLDRGAREVESALAQEPELRARMMTTLADVYGGLGLLPQEHQLLERALSTRLSALGPEAPDTLETTRKLAAVLEAEGRTSEAETLIRRELEVATRALGPQAPETLRSKSLLTRILADEGDRTGAESLARETLQTLRQVQGPRHPDTVQQMALLSILLNREHRFAESEALDREILAIEQETLGPDHPDTLIDLQNIAGDVSNQGKFEEAERVFQELLERLSRVLGPEHPKTLVAKQNLAITHKFARHLEQAEQVTREVLETRRRVLGDQHPDTLVSLGVLASVVKDRGRLAEAERLSRTSLDLRRRLFGPSHPETANAEYDLAGILALAGKRDAALEMLRASLEHRLNPASAIAIDQDSDFAPLKGDPRFVALVADAKRNARAATPGR